MERNVSSWKTENDSRLHEDAQSGFKCDECGERFHKPLLATVTSNKSVQRYYACPQCLTEVRQERKQKSEISQQPFTVKEVAKVAVKLQESVKCNHFFGYLKKREKNSSIPEDCLVCEKMIECMI
jgi:DNA-directed RNA polymerase subunit RPC12/RpoP